MNIPKAIQIIKELPDNVNNVLDFDQQDALRLGIEALKAIQWSRDQEIWAPIRHLPSETED